MGMFIIAQYTSFKLLGKILYENFPKSYKILWQIL